MQHYTRTVYLHICSICIISYKLNFCSLDNVMYYDQKKFVLGHLVMIENSNSRKTSNYTKVNNIKLQGCVDLFNK